MKLKDAIAKIDKTEENRVDIYDMARVFGLDVNDWSDQKRLKYYWLYHWYCTDTYVGYRVYFFDGEPVAISFQQGRKYDESFEWISKEHYNNVKNYVLSFLKEENDEINIVDLDEEYGETFKIPYYSQLFAKHKDNAIYNGEHVKIIDYFDSYNDGTYHEEQVQILFNNNQTLWIPTKELEYPLYVTI